MENNFLPKISLSELEKETDNWDYIFVILKPYWEEINKNIVDDQYEEAEKNFFKTLNNYQFTLFVYNNLCGQVSNGWFIQLIANGYGASVFESPFIKTIWEIGLGKTFSLLEKIKPIYLQYKDEIFEVDNLEDFSDLYEKFEEFENYDDEFYEMGDEELNIFVDFIKNNLEKFVEVE